MANVAHYPYPAPRNLRKPRVSHRFACETAIDERSVRGLRAWPTLAGGGVWSAFSESVARLVVLHYGSDGFPDFLGQWFRLVGF